jgi:hypothetical protein
LDGRSAHNLAKKLGVDAPIIEGIYRVIHEGADPKAVSIEVGRGMGRNYTPQRARFWLLLSLSGSLHMEDQQYSFSCHSPLVSSGAVCSDSVRRCTSAGDVTRAAARGR